MSENTNNDLSETIDSIIDGNAEMQGHSQGTDDYQQSLSENAAPGDNYPDSAQDDGNVKNAQDTPQNGDSVSNAKQTDLDAEIAALKAENENLKKRFHDTQQAMHKANSERSDLQKQLDALKQNDNEDDDWFRDSDNDVEGQDSKINQLKEKIKELENRQNTDQQELRRQKWIDDAEKFAKDHEDFEELVYKRLEPLLSEETGDPMLRTLYLQQEDKSPEGAYNFAKKLFGMKDKLNTDVQNNVSQEAEQTNLQKTNQHAKGKAGLDRINSADFPESRKNIYTNVVDEVFG
jgi:chromosome segregation ATPase